MSDPNTIQDDPHGPNKFEPVHHEPFPNQPIDPDRALAPHRFKLGKKPARPGAVKLKFGDYVNLSTLAAPPAEFGHDKLVGNNWGMLANDRVGDCAIADALHQSLLWNTEVGKTVPLSDAVAIENYSAVTGYDPSQDQPDGTNPTDQGTDVAELVKYRLQTGLIDGAGVRHKIGAAVALEPGNWEQFWYALYYFDGVTLGVNLPQAWMQSFNPAASAVIWDKPKRGAGSKILGGHAITGVAGANNEANIVTWGADIVRLTQAGYEFGSDETYAFFSPEEIANGVDDNGIDVEKLQADLHLLDDVSAA